MSGEKRYTEREVILRERKAYDKGASDAAFGHFAIFGDCDRRRKLAEAEYPLPKVTRPRVVTYRMMNGDDVQFGVTPSGYLAWRESAERQWLPVGDRQWWVEEPMIRLWADLIANPTEEVDAE